MVGSLHPKDYPNLEITSGRERDNGNGGRFAVN